MNKEKILLEYMFGTAIDRERFIVKEMKTIPNTIPITKWNPTYDERLVVTIEEINVLPEELKDKWEIVSHGFYSDESINDFPLRDKAVTLILRKRRWKVKISWEVVWSNIEIKRPHTQATKWLLNFLK